MFLAKKIIIFFFVQTHKDLFLLSFPLNFLGQVKMASVVNNHKCADFNNSVTLFLCKQIKVLYSFEHAIIMIDSPPEFVVSNAEQIAR